MSFPQKVPGTTEKRKKSNFELIATTGRFPLQDTINFVVLPEVPQSGRLFNEKCWLHDWISSCNERLVVPGAALAVGSASLLHSLLRVD